MRDLARASQQPPSCFHVLGISEIYPATAQDLDRASPTSDCNRCNGFEPCEGVGSALTLVQREVQVEIRI
jgi:hypothetical protein